MLPDSAPDYKTTTQGEKQDYLQNKPEVTINDILLIIQQHKQTVQFVAKQPKPIESVSFFSGRVADRWKLIRVLRKKHSTQIFSIVSPKYTTKQEPRSYPAFDKTCNICKRPNNFLKKCPLRKQSTNFSENGSKVEKT